MNRSIALAFIVALLGGCATAPARAPSQAAPDATRGAPALPNPASAQIPHRWLDPRIDAFIAQPRFARADWGISVVSLDSGRTLYSHDAGKLFVPASNAKLYTAALALDSLGADARIPTSLYATAAPDADGTLQGDLILYGRGDPSLGDSDTSPDWADRFAQVLSAQGVRRVRGDLIGDDTYFAGPPFGNGWEAADLQSWYAMPVSALSVQGNLARVQVTRANGRCCVVSLDPADAGIRIVNLTRERLGDALDLYRAPGSDTLYARGDLPAGVQTKSFALSVPDSASFAGNLLRDALTRRGITLDGNVRALHWPQTDPELSANGNITVAEVASPPLAQMIEHMLKYSDNLYAQTLLLQIGVRAAQAGACADRADPPTTSEGWGLCALRVMLARARIANDSATFEEGAGLSRKDLVTPAATTTLLAWAAKQSFANALRNALPIAGVDGTLAHRFVGTPAAGNLRAKTGTLTHAYALSGYVTDAAGEHLAFSLMLDHYQRPTDALDRNIAPSPTVDLDAIAAMLAELTH